MKISTRGRYASRALVEIVINEEKGAVSLTKISEKTGISVRYLEQIMRKLKKHNIVKTEQGVKGGYVLARPASEITLKNIVDILEGEDYPVKCVTNPDSCERIDTCGMLHVWKEVHYSIAAVLEKYSIKELASLYKK
ncbi:MAG: Rrf2 family transcriptional regulator [Candidatus Muiribacteriota bacterium]|jgi:Rrf2 family protein